MLNQQAKLVKTTIELPEELIEQAKIAAIKQKTSLKHIFTDSLTQFLNQDLTRKKNIEFSYPQDQINHFFGVFRDKKRKSLKTEKQLIKEAVIKKFKNKK